jgi:hypothetical protein
LTSLTRESQNLPALRQTPAEAVAIAFYVSVRDTGFWKGVNMVPPLPLAHAGNADVYNASPQSRGTNAPRKFNA